MHTLQDIWLSMQAPILIRQINYTYAWNLCEKDVGGSWGQWRGRRSPWSSPLLSPPPQTSLPFFSILAWTVSVSVIWSTNCLLIGFCGQLTSISFQVFSSWAIGFSQTGCGVRFNGPWTFANRLLTNGQCNIHLKNALTKLLDICTAWSTSESISVYM